MLARVLRPAEYAQLADTEVGPLWSQLSDQTRVVIVEDRGQLVGCHVLVPVVHAECLWIHPAHRGKTSVARRLWTGVQREVREHFQARGFATAAISEDVRRLLQHVQAEPIPGQHFMVRI
jgi:hypothetical protein